MVFFGSSCSRILRRKRNNKAVTAGLHLGAERRLLDAVLIHKTPRQVKSPFNSWLLPSQRFTAGLAARTGVQRGDFDSTGTTRQLKTTDHSDRFWELVLGQKLSILGIYFQHRVNFPSGFLRFFRLVFQRRPTLKK